MWVDQTLETSKLFWLIWDIKAGTKVIGWSHFNKVNIRERTCVVYVMRGRVGGHWHFKQLWRHHSLLYSLADGQHRPGCWSWAAGRERTLCQGPLKQSKEKSHPNNLLSLPLKFKIEENEKIYNILNVKWNYIVLQWFIKYLGFHWSNFVSVDPREKGKEPFKNIFRLLQEDGYLNMEKWMKWKISMTKQ